MTKISMHLRLRAAICPGMETKWDKPNEPLDSAYIDAATGCAIA